MRLEQEIVEIHTVFMDLATIVNQKWEELNRIEDHLNGAFDNGLFICYVISDGGGESSRFITIFLIILII